MSSSGPSGVVREVLGVSLGHAKALVHFSPAFADQRAAHEALHDSLIDAIYQIEEAESVSLDHPSDDVERQVADLRAALTVTLRMVRREVGPDGALTVPPDSEILREVRRLRQLADAPPDPGSSAKPAEDAATAAAWDTQLAVARDDDERRRNRLPSWVPPIMADLVTAAVNSRLHLLFPFTSHNMLRFARFADLGLWERTKIAPVFVAVVPDLDRYLVYAGEFSEELPDPVLETDDPAVAVAEVVFLNPHQARTWVDALLCRPGR